MPRGRPVSSNIRQNIVDILYYLGSGYGYEIYGIYRMVFPKCTNEVIYYHLKKGTLLGLFDVDRLERSSGDYSWGPLSEKTYYKLGPKAKPRINEVLRKAIEMQRQVK